MILIAARIDFSNSHDSGAPRLRHAADHLQRLATAAAHFGYPWDAAQCGIACTNWRKPTRKACGAFACCSTPKARHAPKRLPWTQHPPRCACNWPTTRRAHYDAFTPTQSGVFDTVLSNDESEITECTRGNVAMLIDGHWVAV